MADNCKFLDGPLSADGHALVDILGWPWRADRIICAYLQGLKLDGKWTVVHTCGNEACINANHMYATRGSKRIPRLRHPISVDDLTRHIADVKAGKERPLKVAEKEGGDRLFTADDARAVYVDTRPARVVAQDYCISWHTVKDIRRGRRWAEATASLREQGKRHG